MKTTAETCSTRVRYLASMLLVLAVAVVELSAKDWLTPSRAAERAEKNALARPPRIVSASVEFTG